MLLVFNFLFLQQIITDRDYFVLGSPWLPMTIFRVLLGLCFFWKPNSLAVTALLAISQLTLTAFSLPYVGSHTLVTITMSIWALTTCWSLRHEKSASQPFSVKYGQAGPMLFFWFYFWASFHKLNWGFIDPYLSCAFGVPHRLLWTLFGIQLPGSAPLGYILIATAFFFELLLPQLVFFRAKKWALIFLMLFHYLLSINYADFFPLLITIFVSFFHEDEIELVRQKISRFFLEGKIGFLRLLLALVGTQVYLSLWRVSPTHKIAVLTGLFLANGFLIFILIQALRKGTRDLARPRFAWSPAILITLLMGIQCVGPYLGYRTGASLSMYSNLRLDDGDNHFFNSEWLRVSDRGADWVHFHKDSLMLLYPSFIHVIFSPRGDLKIPRFELARMIRQRDEETNRALWRFNLESISFADFLKIGEIYDQAPWYQKWIFTYRPVLVEKTPVCQW